MCKNYSKEGICQFKEFCAYKHEKVTNQNNSVKHLITNHEKEISTMKHELNQIKKIVSQMGNQIMIHSQEQKKNSKEKCKRNCRNVVKTIHNSKASEMEQKQKLICPLRVTFVISTVRKRT